MEPFFKCKAQTLRKVFGAHPRRVSHNRSEPAVGENVGRVHLEGKEWKRSIRELPASPVEFPTNVFEGMKALSLRRREADSLAEQVSAPCCGSEIIPGVVYARVR